ncbi:TolC family protein [Planctomicrobium piriforme]|uniref:Outer membrane efflux protein n=1 Tax=Planctomicrobium piriforme TaxID=1576369 RepID=A0A1I3G597_9PLAN|nr:TolC family protein [Planctomicrobium piriforme]SFI18675.1 Outer membrane efflux protein [Planctomicrobium piriforme]
MHYRRSAQSAGKAGSQKSLAVCLAVCLLLAACRQPHDPIQYHGKPKPADYIDQATRITYPDLDLPPEPDVVFSQHPRTVRSKEKEEIWDLSLAECIQLTLTNSKVIRNQGQFLSPQNPIMSYPDNVSSVYDPAIQESGVLFGQRGVEAALADFDTRLTSQMLWGRNETVQNNTLSLGLPAGETLTQETGAFSTGLRKQLATGGVVNLSQSWNYTGSNIGTPPLLFPSVYEGTAQLQFRQPLLAGGGVEYTRIAGPISDNIQGVTGVQQGVIITRINDDIALADFERNVQQMVHDVETLYWQLHLAYRTYNAMAEARDSALEIWRTVDSQVRGDTGSGGAQEAELRDSYLTFEGQVEASRDAIYAGEAQLRLLMGLPVNDGRVIRPIDEPVTAEFAPDWQLALEQAFRHRPEVRRQKWNIRSLELQCRAAENLLMPRLDFVSSYQLNGFGDDLFDIGNGTATGQYASAYKSLASRDQTGWNLGFEFSVPFGRRYAHAQVRSLELRLSKAQAMLSEQEVEISHEVAAVFRDIDRNFVAMENAFNRLQVSKERVRITESQYHNDPTQYPIESIVRAQQALSQAHVAFVTALLQYQTAIGDLYYRTGRTLVVNNVHLMEGPWCAAAQVDADRNYKARQYAHPPIIDRDIVDPVSAGSDSSFDGDPTFIPDVLPIQQRSPEPTPSSEPDIPRLPKPEPTGPPLLIQLPDELSLE